MICIGSVVFCLAQKEKKQLSLYLSIYDNIKDKQLLKNNVLYVCFYIAYNIIYLLNK